MGAKAEYLFTMESQQIYLLNNKYVCEKDIIDKKNNNEINLIRTTNNPREAVLYFGEKYCEPTYAYETDTNEISHPNDEFVIIGTTKMILDDHSIMLFTFQGDSIISVDTTTVKNSSFYFYGIENLNGIALITTGNCTDKVINCDVILERGKINVNFDSISSVSGTFLNNLYQSYIDSIRLMDRAVINEYQQNIEDKENPNRDIYIKLINQRIFFRRNFYLKNMLNIVGQTVFIREIGLEWDTDFLNIYNTLPNHIKSNPSVRKYYLFRKEQEKKDSLSSQLINERYVDYEVITLSNEKRSISDYVGKSKYLFIDIWASWCGPCVADMPKLKKIYEKYKDGGLEMISISIDKDMKPWISAINKYQTPWPNLIDLSGGKKLQESYGCSGIPCGILLDQKGTVIGNMLNSELLDQCLKNLYP